MVPADDLPNDDPFDRDAVAGTPLGEAVAELAARTGGNLDDWQGRRLGEILQLAEDHYGDQLPRFWRVWKDWNTPQPPQSMGDL